MMGITRGVVAALSFAMLIVCCMCLSALCATLTLLSSAGLVLMFLSQVVLVETLGRIVALPLNRFYRGLGMALVSDLGLSISWLWAFREQLRRRDRAPGRHAQSFKAPQRSGARA
jgi:hypothetical protein